jgi:hypothetical protein
VLAPRLSAGLHLSIARVPAMGFAELRYCGFKRRSGLGGPIHGLYKDGVDEMMLPVEKNRIV